MVYTLVFRCFCICQNFAVINFYDTELTSLKGLFSKHGYTWSFFDKCFKKFLNNIHLIEKNVQTVEKNRLLLVLPYLDVCLWWYLERIDSKGSLTALSILSLIMISMFLLYEYISKSSSVFVEDVKLISANNLIFHVLIFWEYVWYIF